MKLEKSLIFMGVPGSGKTTQSNIISQKLQAPRVSASDMFRSEGISTHFPIQDDVAYYTAHKYLKPFLGSSIILDGFYRTAGNFQAVKEIFPDVQIIFLKVHSTEALKRILEGKRQRDDDKDTENLLRRIENDISKHKSLAQKNEIIEINGSSEVNRVTKEILEILQKKSLLTY